MRADIESVYGEKQMRRPKSMIFETTFSKFFNSGIIGEGGSGCVYKVTDETGKFYAIKVLDPSKANGEKLKRFKNEILFQQKNQHSNIVTIVDYGYILSEEIKSPFYVMPLFDESLRELMLKKIPLDKVIHYFGQLLDSVEAAHYQKVIHRDLKPENILYDKKKQIIGSRFWNSSLSARGIIYAGRNKTWYKVSKFSICSPRTKGTNYAN